MTFNINYINIKSLLLLYVLIHFITLIWVFYKNKVKKSTLCNYTKYIKIFGWKKSIFGDLLRIITLFFLILLPIFIHLCIVLNVFYLGIFNQETHEELWPENAKNYALSLANIIYLLLFWQILIFLNEGFNLIFLVPSELSNCDYVSINIDNPKEIKCTKVCMNLLLGKCNNNTHLARIEVCKIEYCGKLFNRYFIFNNERFWWLKDQFIWSRNILNILNPNIKLLNNFEDKESEMNIIIDNNRDSISKLVGINRLEVEDISFLKYILDEITSVMNIFRFITLIDCLFYSFIIWPLCWCFITILSIYLTISRRYNHNKYMKQLVSMHDKDYISIISDLSNINRREVNIPVTTLVPGDIIILNKLLRIPADIVLLTENITVDESLISGESTPQHKVKFNGNINNLFTPQEYRRTDNYILFEGTNIIDLCSSFDNLGLVVRTGATTLRGSILYNKIVCSKFGDINICNNEILQNCNPTWIFSVGLLWTFCFIFGYFISCIDVIFLNFDIGALFFVVATILYILPFWSPLFITSTVERSINRLKDHNIYCTNSNDLIQHKFIDTIFFDKTGTLTLNKYYIRNFFIYNGNNSNNDNLNLLFYLILATCNNLIYPNIKNKKYSENQGSKLEECLQKFSGYSLLRVQFKKSERLFAIPKENFNLFYTKSKMFEYSLEQDHINCIKYFQNYLEYLCSICNAVEVLVRFPFDQKNRSQSVIIRRYIKMNSLKSAKSYSYTKKTIYLIKGAIEQIINLSLYNKKDKLQKWISEKSNNQMAGSYIIGMGYKDIPNNIDYLNINMFKDVKLLGIIELFTPIRQEAQSIITLLQEVNIKCCIVTGDSLTSAIHVANSVHILHYNHLINNCSILICDVDSNRKIIWKLRTYYNNIIGNELDEKILEEYDTFYVNDPFFNSVPKDLTSFKNIALMSSVLLNIYESYLDDQISYFYEDLSKSFIMKYILMNATIFARFTPDLKEIIVSYNQNFGKTILSIGDGFNDCAALRKSSFGIFLTSYKNNIDSIAPFICLNTYNELESIPRLIIESKIVTTVSIIMYLHMTLLGTLIISCKSTLLWISQGMIPGLAWLFIDIFCALIPLLLISLSTPKIYETNKENLLSEKLYDKNTNIINLKSKYPLIGSLNKKKGNLIFYFGLISSFIINYCGFIIVMYRLIHFILPKYNIPPAYEFNINIPPHLWYIRQDNIESSSAWCYLVFQLINQSWIITQRGSFIVKIKINKFLISWVIIINIFILFCIWTPPCQISCILRINCDDITSRSINLFNIIDLSSPFYGIKKDNIFPIEWKSELSLWCILFSLINFFSIFIINKIFI
ncbi:E1-E2 ATPase family protein [Cryptosporidium andersoni]|uniref:E1-E2 ATPase family protein n=1 Tax=Cryptosporidium andersoni TaxID=117008 RepID=A0A1J4MLT7_9CRYT|nr:E1-E2 ATPase family protein [Cryptosporidium andersoni]